jgi:hypothetical protein
MAFGSFPFKFFISPFFSFPLSQTNLPFRHQTALVQRKRKEKFGGDKPIGSAPLPVLLSPRENSGSSMDISRHPESLVYFHGLRIRIPIQYRILRRAYIVKSVFGKTIT